MFTSHVVLDESSHLPSQEELLLVQFLLRFSDSTREIYKVRLRMFVEWCVQHDLNPIHDVKRVHMELYLEYLLKVRHNAPSTAAGALTTIASFYHMLCADDVIVKNPAAYVKPPRVHQESIKRTYLNRTGFCDLLEYARASSQEELVLVMLLGVMGLRASEVATLHTRNFATYSQGYCMVTFVGKGDKPAALPMPLLVQREVDIYLDSIGNDYLFKKQGGAVADRRAIYRDIRRISKRAGYSDISPHSLRRSMVTNSLNAGADIREVQKSARHADIRTTSRIYDQGPQSMDSSSFHVLSGFISGAI